MATEIFRFVTIRPPQQVDVVSSADTVIDLGAAKSPVIEALRKLRVGGSRSGMTGEVIKFIATDAFIDTPRKLNSKLLAFAAAVQRLPATDFWSGAQEAFRTVFGVTPESYAGSAPFTTSFAQVATSIVGATIDGEIAPKVRSLLVRASRAMWLVTRLANGAPITRSAYMTAPLALPEGIFPLPDAVVDIKGGQRAEAKASAAAIGSNQKRLSQLVGDLSSRRRAIDDLLSTFAQNTLQPAPKPESRGKSAARTTSPAGFVLTDVAAKALSADTTATLKKGGIGGTAIDVAKSVALLDRQSSAIASQLFGNANAAGTMIRIGNSIIPQGALEGGGVVLQPMDERTPGPCPPVINTSPPNDTATVPVSHGDARILGIADLMVLEQNLLRYQLGEIARIENVLKSEVRSRRFKTTDTTEQTQTTATETTEDKERDLSSSERFQLQTESQTVINESASKEAGLTIHASYGPSVDATANYNTSSSTSTQQSNTASTNYAREVTNKAVDRVQTRTLTSRTVTTIHVIEEVNEHSFDNKEGPGDIIGVYRYVDKVYRAQVVNYGKRLMLEFIVPEPAAFLRYALTNKPIDNVTQTNPEPPGYCLANGTSFVALQALDISRDNYLYWASKYGAQDVTSPPAQFTIATASKKGPDSMPEIAGRAMSSDVFDVTIPDGYLAQSAFVNVYGETQEGQHQVVYQLQEQQGFYVEPWEDNVVYPLQPTPTLAVSVNSIGFHNWELIVTAFCTLSTEKDQSWQLKTFASIMNAYNDLKSAYDQAIQEAKLQASDSTVNGTNPESNAITEQIELRKGCISLLTGQRFDLFDSVARNVAPYGYPEIDFTEAKAEGPYIAFFEQSFEWNNMVYLFYPYFWGKKDQWVTVAQLKDSDPLFAQFLQAGAARVQVPVRLGFEEAMLTYLSTGELWAGEGTLVNADSSGVDSDALSIIDELKSQTGNNNIDGVGTLSVTKSSATVTGSGTAFTKDDENKRIIIDGVTYVIRTWTSETSIVLTTPYLGDSADGLGYAIGGKLVGQPWEVKLPTNLVKLDNSLVFA